MTETKATTLSALLATRGQSERHFFTWLATAIVLLVFAGFSRTYYLHSLFKMPELSFCMLPNPIVRLFIWAGFGSNVVIQTLWALLVTAVVLLDSMRNRRLHPAFGFVATITIAFLYIAYFGSLTPLWQRVAANAVG